jgi:hypothetical protein
MSHFLSPSSKQRSTQPTYSDMRRDPFPRFASTRGSWDRRVRERQNPGRRRTDNPEQRRTARVVARLGLAVKIGVSIALVAAIGATVVAWRANVLSGPVAVLVVLAVTVPWAVAQRLASRSRPSIPFPQVDRRIWLP